jgi:hypothetical protein
MTERESDVLVAYLHSARVDWADRVTPALMRVWYDVLGVFPADLAQRALKRFHGQRAAGRQGFPPELGEVVHFLDASWQAQTAHERVAIAQEDRGAAQRLLTGPAEAWGAKGSLALVAVDLVRDLCDEKMVPGSDAHVSRQAEVDRLAGPMPAPCCDRGGLTSYVIVRWGRPYTYAARCDCDRGQQSPHVGYPVLPLGSARPDGVP